jgi:PRTRC genetic system protein C
MPIKITTPVRVFRHNGMDYADPAPSADVERAVELLSTVNTELMNAIIDPGAPEDGKIVYSLKTAIGTKGAGHRFPGDEGVFPEPFQMHGEEVITAENNLGLTKHELFAAIAMHAAISAGIPFSSVDAVAAATMLVNSLDAVDAT